MHGTHHVRLSLFTLNCFGVPFLSTHARLKTLGQALNESQVDVLLLQEVQLARYVPILREVFSNFSYSAHEPFLFAPKGGLLILSRYPLIEAEFTLYAKRGPLHTPAAADWMLHKGFLKARVALPGIIPVTVINTHLVANYSADWSKSNRYARHQLAEVRQLAAAVNHVPHDALVAVGGDFNFPRRSWLYHEFGRLTGTYDPLHASDEPTFRPPRLFRSRHTHALDHVFVRKPRRAECRATARIVLQDPIELVNGRQGHLSDHYGIQAEIEASLKRPEEAPLPAIHDPVY
jgi:endonuclease/exonuclease/phosphatase family metal-dependent hydrolase